VTSNAGTPNGTVTFKVGKTVLGTVTLGGTGQASLVTTAIPVGSNTISAVYNGNALFLASTGTTVQQVTGTATSTTLTSSLNPSQFGQPVTFTATVTAASGTPTGNVKFQDGKTILATIPLNTSGVATYTTAGLAVGGHKIVAYYLGAIGFAASQSPALLQHVRNANVAVISFETLVFEMEQNVTSIVLSVPRTSIAPPARDVLAASSNEATAAATTARQSKHKSQRPSELAKSVLDHFFGEL
jgi:hypothetical protein